MFLNPLPKKFQEYHEKFGGYVDLLSRYPLVLFNICAVFGNKDLLKSALINVGDDPLRTSEYSE